MTRIRKQWFPDRQSIFWFEQRLDAVLGPNLGVFNGS